MVPSGMELDTLSGREEEKIEISRRPYISYNPYFFVPFFIWMIAGGIALLAFDKQELFAMVNTRHYNSLDALMVAVTSMGEGAVIVSLLVSLLIFRPLRNKWYVIAALLTNAIPSIIVQAIKSSVNAPRPLNVYKQAEWIHILPEWPQLMERSFPSGHTCAAFCLFSFIAFFLPRGYRGWGILLFGLGLLVGISRLYLAAHFFLDIYVGSIIGTTFTTGIIYLLEQKWKYFFRYVRNR